MPAPTGTPPEGEPGHRFESTHAWCGQCLQHPVHVEARALGVNLSSPACGWEEA
jgi:hypothetical protein